jgi:pyruvate dehydrogenase E1 component alpha subunit/2-oxoisovalerate dehydrogenase E1 component alpha subunit
MKRYPAYDPPEYHHWQPDPQVMAAYRATLETDPAKQNLWQSLSVAELLALYAGLLRNRLHDITLKRWVKTGVISKAWLGTGEEAVTIGGVHALNRQPFGDGMPTDFVAPMIRNAGACHEMGMDLAAMFRGYLATLDSPTQGRDLHIGSLANGVLAPISHVGDIIAVCGGVALNFKMRGQPRVVITWAGDGTTKTGVFHEALNFAAVQHLPLIIVIQNNQVALGTQLDQHHRGDFGDWPAGYGIAGWKFDGNNVLDAYAATRRAADLARNGQGPVLLIAETFRLGGHATHDEDEARRTFPNDLFTYWGNRDPIGCYETYLIESGKDLQRADGKVAKRRSASALKTGNQEILAALETQVTAEVEQAAEEALKSRQPQQLATAAETLSNVYAIT